MNFNDLRKELGFTQKQVSELLGIPLRTIENWCSNISSCPVWTEELVNARLCRVNSDLEFKKENYKYEFLGHNRFEFEVIKLNDKIIILDGWNGEKYLNCSEIKPGSDFDYPDIIEDNIELKPVYYFETLKKGDELIDILDENNIDFNDTHLLDIVDYE